MPAKLKVNCPDKYHAIHKHSKFLFGFKERRGKSPRVFFFHCPDMHCKQWLEVSFNEKGGFIVKILNPRTPLNMTNVPFLVKDENE